MTPTGELDPANPIDSRLLARMRELAVPVTESGSVLAHVIDNGVWVEVRGVLAGVPRVPGDVGRWLDGLPRDRRVIVPAVVSARLAGMLLRRGFQAGKWWDARIGMFDDGALVRGPD